MRVWGFDKVGGWRAADTLWRCGDGGMGSGGFGWRLVPRWEFCIVEWVGVLERMRVCGVGWLLLETRLCSMRIRGAESACLALMLGFVLLRARVLCVCLWVRDFLIRCWITVQRTV